LWNSFATSFFNLAPPMRMVVKNSFLETIDDENPSGRLKRSWSADQFGTQSMSSYGVDFEEPIFSETYSTGVLEEKHGSADPQHPFPENTWQADASVSSSGVRSEANVDASNSLEVIDCDPSDWPEGPSTQLLPPLSAEGLNAWIQTDAQRLSLEQEMLEGHVHVLQTHLQQTEAGWDPCIPSHDPLQQIHTLKGQTEGPHSSQFSSRLGELSPSECTHVTMPARGLLVPEGTRVSAEQWAAELANRTRKMQMADDILQDTANGLWRLAHEMKAQMENSRTKANFAWPSSGKEACSCLT